MVSSVRFRTSACYVVCGDSQPTAVLQLYNTATRFDDDSLLLVVLPCVTRASLLLLLRYCRVALAKTNCRVLVAVKGGRGGGYFCKPGVLY